MKTISSSPASPTAESSAQAVAGDELHRRIHSTDLLGTRREVQIEHAGELYTLRQTSKGKLILTK